MQFECLKVGLRWDRVVHDNNLGAEVARLSELQPRVGLAWDATGDGRTLLRASWGRFMHPGTGLLAASTNALSDSRDELWFSCSGIFGIDDPAACSALAASLGLGYRSDQEAWDPAGWVLDPAFVTSPEPNRTVAGLRANLVEQWSIGIERELFPDASLELGYVDRRGDDFFETTCNGNLPEPVVGAACDFLVVSNRPEMRSSYEAWIARFETRSLDRFHLSASWVYSEAMGSTDFNSGVTEGFDIFPVHFENRYGYLPSHSRHRVKLSGYYLLPWDVSLFVYGWWDSERRWTPVRPAQDVDPSYYGEIFVEPRGSRSIGSLHEVSLQVGKGFQWGRTRVRLFGTIENLLDTEQERSVCERISGCGSDVELGDPVEWQQPRRYSLGFRIEF